jgi:protein gp37
MAENTAIEWCDHTLNPWEGCQKVGPGCDHCYAETRNARFGGGTATNWGPKAPRRRTSVSNWRKPLRWQADAAAFQAKHSRRQRVFCASLADVFDNSVDPAWRTDLFELIRATPDLDWLLLTKRIGNAAPMAEAAGGWPANVWLGATIVNQGEAERDIPKLLAFDGGPRIRFLSMEPLLGMVDLTKVRWHVGGYPMDGALPKPGEPDDFVYWAHRYALSWVIVGGESGSGARPMHPDWARLLRDQCAAAGVPFLFKQWGEWAPMSAKDDAEALSPAFRDARGSKSFRYPEGPRMAFIGKKAAGRLLDGVQHDGSPS